MRKEISNAIYLAALKNRDIYFLTADLEHPSGKDFSDNIPLQHINVGMAEQNMIGIAAGLALSGKKVFVMSIMPFATMRCYEQIRNDLCYQNLDVTVIGAGGGFYYGKSGPTHNALETISIMRALPNMKIYAPADSIQAQLITEHLLGITGPNYLHSAGKVVPIISELRSTETVVGRGQIVRAGSDITIFSFGPIIAEALSAAKILAEANISCEIINLHSLKPIDRALIQHRAIYRKGIFTLEEHSIIGGLGSAVAEIISQMTLPQPLVFRCFGINDKFEKIVGSRQCLWKLNGLSGESIAQQILSLKNSLWGQLV